MGRKIREATAGSGKKLTLELGGKSPYIVFDDADLDSAIEGLVDAIWFNQGQVCCAGSRLLVQEGIADDLLHPPQAPHGRPAPRRPARQMHRRRRAVVDPVQLKTITNMVDGSAETSTARTPICPRRAATTRRHSSLGSRPPTASCRRKSLAPSLSAPPSAHPKRPWSSPTTPALASPQRSGPRT